LGLERVDLLEDVLVVDGDRAREAVGVTAAADGVEHPPEHGLHVLVHHDQVREGAGVAVGLDHVASVDGQVNAGLEALPHQARVANVGQDALDFFRLRERRGDQLVAVVARGSHELRLDHPFPALDVGPLGPEQGALPGRELLEVRGRLLEVDALDRARVAAVVTDDLSHQLLVVLELHLREVHDAVAPAGELELHPEQPTFAFYDRGSLGDGLCHRRGRPEGEGTEEGAREEEPRAEEWRTQ
jgi:hypothetical protein